MIRGIRRLCEIEALKRPECAHNSNSMFLSFFSTILIGLYAKLNVFYTSIKKTHAYEYFYTVLITNCT